jgi:CHRD domain-containing protein
MRRFLPCLLVLTFCVACSPAGGSRPAGSLTAPSLDATVAASIPKNFRAHLSGDQVVPVLPVPTLAQGEAIFQPNPDGTELSVRVLASNIENVVGAHIHLAAEGVRGPLVALLMAPVSPAGGRSDGVLTHGTLTAAQLFGPLAGQSLSALIDAMAAGNAYVDIPTNDGVAPPNTGTGDYPGGELRGQID